MGYRISYEGTGVVRTPLRVKKGGWRMLAVGAALIVVLGIPQVRRTIREVVIPGNDEITADALERFVLDLRNGEAFDEAVEAFCMEIIHGG